MVPVSKKMAARGRVCVCVRARVRACVRACVCSFPYMALV